MKCEHCGQELKAGAQFCENCGAPVNVPVSESAAEHEPPRHWEGFANVPQEEEEKNTVMDALKDVKVSARMEVRTPFGSGAKGLKRTAIVVAVIILVLLVVKFIGG